MVTSWIGDSERRGRESAAQARREAEIRQLEQRKREEEWLKEENKMKAYLGRQTKPIEGVMNELKRKRYKVTESFDYHGGSKSFLVAGENYAWSKEISIPYLSSEDKWEAYPKTVYLCRVWNLDQLGMLEVYPVRDGSGLLQLRGLYMDVGLVLDPKEDGVVLRASRGQGIDLELRRKLSGAIERQSRYK